MQIEEPQFQWRLFKFVENEGQSNKNLHNFDVITDMIVVIGK